MSAKILRLPAHATFAARVIALREARHMTRAHLARVSGINYATLGNYENGTYSPRLEDMNAVARALEVPVTDLMPDAPKPEPDGEIAALTARVHLLEAIFLAIRDGLCVLPDHED